VKVLKIILASSVLALPLLAGTTVQAQEQRPSDPGKRPEVEHLARERGVSMSEAAKRIGWQSRSVEVRDAVAAKLGRDFGGLWIDFETDRPVVAAITGRERTRERVRPELAQARIENVANVVEVAYALADLQSMQESLTADIAYVNEGSIEPVDARVNEPKNRVVVMVPPGVELTDRQQDYVDRALESPMVMREETPTKGIGRTCAQQGILVCNAPLRGGTNLFLNGSFGCTAGFNTRDAGGTAYLMSAGHCFDPRVQSIPVGSRMLDGINHYIGGRHAARFDTGGDFGIVRINDPGASGWNIRAWVAVTNSQSDGDVAGSTVNWEYPIRTTGGTLDFMRVCTTGAARAQTSCGRVTNRDTPFTYTAPGWGEVRVAHLASANFCGQGGDSGGPVYADNIAYGLHVTGTSEGSCYSFYQGIVGAENAMNVKVARSG
jgi:hypothetical protein